jgi:hypothetical protein
MLSAEILITNGVTVRSVNGAANTIIDGNGSVRCVSLSHPNAVLEGFAVRGGHGGGVYCGPGSSVRRCVISDNVTDGYGGGVFCNGGIVQNCLIIGNSSSRNEGGGVYCSSGLVQNCTILGNHADEDGGGIMGYNGGLVENSIICFNTSGESGADCYGSIVRYSCSPLLTSGEGNIAGTPQFADFAAADYHLQSGSPCVDAGVNQACMSDADDLDGNPRIINAVVDMGAYEIDLPDSPDYDGDGLKNNEERLIYGTSHIDFDSDDDGISDGDEVLRTDTDPTNAASLLVLTNVMLQGTSIRVDWQGGSDATQVIECCDDLVTTNWIPIYTNTPPTLTNYIIDAGVTNPALFYRIRIP